MGAASTGFRQRAEECLARYVRNGPEAEAEADAEADAALTFLAALRRARSRPPETGSASAPGAGEPGSTNKEAGGPSSAPLPQRRGPAGDDARCAGNGPGELG